MDSQDAEGMGPERMGPQDAEGMGPERMGPQDAEGIGPEEMNRENAEGMDLAETRAMDAAVMRATDPGGTRETGPGETRETGPDDQGPWYRRAWIAFRGWRRTRPFWAGLLCLVGAMFITYGPLAVFRFILVSGTVVWAGILMGVLVGAMGLFLWFTPSFHQILGILAAIFSVVSLITSNFGGYFVGLLLGALGGAMGFAWTPLAVRGSETGPQPNAPPADGWAPPASEPAAGEPSGGDLAAWHPAGHEPGGRDDPGSRSVPLPAMGGDVKR